MGWYRREGSSTSDGLVLDGRSSSADRLVLDRWSDFADVLEFPAFDKDGQ
jgi:hypothetical protein